ncbi:MAG: hypothetical protein ACRD82_04055 [Blastocatellia bacterium]
MNHTIRLLEDDDYDLNDDGEPEYDFAELRRRAIAEGREYRGQAARRIVRLAPDIAQFFPDEDAVNQALREIVVSRMSVNVQAQTSPP